MERATNDPELTFLRFAAGRASLRDLSRVGVAIEVDGPSVRVSVERLIRPVEVEAQTLASGLLTHAQAGSEQTFAKVVLALLSIDLEPLHGSVEGERLLELLWNASSGRRIPRVDQQFLAEVAARST